MNFCKDCEHFRQVVGFADCAIAQDPVYGETQNCRDERLNPQGCGPLGEHFVYRADKSPPATNEFVAPGCERFPETK